MEIKHVWKVHESQDPDGGNGGGGFDFGGGAHSNAHSGGGNVAGNGAGKGNAVRRRFEPRGEPRVAPLSRPQVATRPERSPAPPPRPTLPPTAAIPEPELPKKETLRVPEIEAVEDAIRITRAERGPTPAGTGVPKAGTGSPGSGAAAGGWAFERNEPKDGEISVPAGSLSRAEGLEEALSLLRAIPTGRRLLGAAAQGMVEFKESKKLAAPVLYDYKENRLRFDPRVCRDRAAWNAAELAALLAHELQHAAQAFDKLPPGSKKLEYESHTVAQITLDELERKRKAPALRDWLKDEREAWLESPERLEQLARRRYAGKPPDSPPGFYQQHLTRPFRECRDNKPPSRPIQCLYSLEEIDAIDERYEAFKKAVQNRRSRSAKGGR